MYVVTGITGKVGGAVASALLEAGLSVRAVVRDDEKGITIGLRTLEDGHVFERSLHLREEVRSNCAALHR
jgi:nucleoside-diphosphate-sugar epimerase